MSTHLVQLEGAGLLRAWRQGQLVGAVVATLLFRWLVRAPRTAES